jgi:hypothetical protein
MTNFIYRRGYRSHFLHQIVAIHDGGKVGRINAIPIKLFSVNSYDLKSMPIKFGNAIFIRVILLAKKHFIAVPSICNQRSLATPIQKGFIAIKRTQNRKKEAY